jgi:hypothetical protein
MVLTPLNHSIPISVAPKAYRKSPVSQKVLAKSGITRKMPRLTFPAPQKVPMISTPGEEVPEISPDARKTPKTSWSPKNLKAPVRLIYPPPSDPKETRPSGGAVNIVTPGLSVIFPT